MYGDVEGTTELKPEDVVVRATGHKYENGKCSVCQADDPSYKTESETVTPPATDNTTTIPTGDNSQVWLYVIVMLGACVAAGAVYKNKKRQS